MIHISDTVQKIEKFLLNKNENKFKRGCNLNCVKACS